MAVEQTREQGKAIGVLAGQEQERGAVQPVWWCVCVGQTDRAAFSSEGGGVVARHLIVT